MSTIYLSTFFSSLICFPEQFKPTILKLKYTFAYIRVLSYLNYFSTYVIDYSNTFEFNAVMICLCFIGLNGNHKNTKTFTRKRTNGRQ